MFCNRKIYIDEHLNKTEFEPILKRSIRKLGIEQLGESWLANVIEYERCKTLIDWRMMKTLWEKISFASRIFFKNKGCRVWLNLATAKKFTRQAN